MKIGSSLDPSAPLSPPGTTVSGRTSTADTKVHTATPEEGSATVALSSTATTLLAGSQAAEFDTAKVERISKAIAEGKFTVNPEAIADKLIANAQELLSRSGRS